MYHTIAPVQYTSMDYDGVLQVPTQGVQLSKVAWNCCRSVARLIFQGWLSYCLIQSGVQCPVRFKCKT